ncbi:MAG TPA: DUF5719 family protein [Acidothermaceae bacterium]|jgi:hypothetical protein|nr:DUF5719 family protein [Acidothermaceae bacterium]
MRTDPRLLAVPVVLVVVGVTWIAATVAPSPAGSIAAKSSVIALQQASLACPQAGGVPDGGAARIAYADAATTATSPAASPIASPAAASSPVLSGGGLAGGALSAGGGSSVASLAATPSPAVSAVASGVASSVASSPAASSPASSARGGGSVTTTALGVGTPIPAAPQSIPLRPGHGWVVDGPATQAPVAITATGPVTDSLSAVQFTRAPVSGEAQISTAQCGSPTTNAWFAGFSSNVGAHASLLLTNIDAVPATVDVSIWGAQGGEPDTRRGIAVAAMSQVAVPLDQIEPGLPVGVAQVVATSGRIVPAVRDDAENGSIPLGVDWLPPTAAPATTQTVPGILGDAGPRHLIVGNPGAVDANFSLTVVTADGAFMPTQFTSLTVDAGEVSDVSLDPVLQGEAAAILITSSQPVVAGGISMLPSDAVGGSDFAFTAAVPPLSGPTVVAGGEVGAGRVTQLVLSAPSDDAPVEVVLLPSLTDAPPIVNDTTVPGGTTKVLDLATLTTDPAPAVVVIPQGGGPLYAAWSLQEIGASSSGLTELVLQTPVRSLPRAPARFDPAAGLP